MPNWCYNVVEISHENPEMMERLTRASKTGLCQEFIPCPQELIDTQSISYGDEAKQTEQVAKTNANIEKYGYATWYEFNIANWGTKWDVTEFEVLIEDGMARINFDTAWSPPLPVYDALLDLGFYVKACYYEEGMAFAGVWENAFHEEFDLSDMTADDAEAMLPVELVETFNIVEQMRDNEAEPDEE